MQVRQTSNFNLFDLSTYSQNKKHSRAFGEQNKRFTKAVTVPHLKKSNSYKYRKQHYIITWHKCVTHSG